VEKRRRKKPEKKGKRSKEAHLDPGDNHAFLAHL
jgi:hypothetical protein